MEQKYKVPLEDLRKGALEHYEKASSAIHHWSSFVENAIKAYNPEESADLAAYNQFISGHNSDKKEEMASNEDLKQRFWNWWNNREWWNSYELTLKDVDDGVDWIESNILAPLQRENERLKLQVQELDNPKRASEVSTPSNEGSSF